MSRHPSEQDLALFTTNDLGWWRGSGVRKHVASCAACRGVLNEFYQVENALADAQAFPAEISWTALGMDMRGNIRVGLAAGEAIEGKLEPRRMRLAAAGACLVVLLATGLWLEKIHVPVARVTRFPGNPVISQDVVLESTTSGIQVRDGARLFQVASRPSNESVSTASLNGEMGSRSVDSDGDGITITNVYANREYASQ